MRAARAENGTVVEIVEVPDEFQGRASTLGDFFHEEANFFEVAEDVEVGWREVGEEFVDPTSLPEEPLTADKLASFHAEVDAAAEAARHQFITPGSGQAMTYAQKAEEARLCLSSGAPDSQDYPLLAAEIGITAPTLVEVAQVVAAANGQWLQIGAAIEAARLSAKKAISAATTIEEARSAARAAAWPAA